MRISFTVKIDTVTTKVTRIFPLPCSRYFIRILKYFIWGWCPSSSCVAYVFEISLIVVLKYLNVSHAFYYSQHQFYFPFKKRFSSYKISNYKNKYRMISPIYKLSTLQNHNWWRNRKLSNASCVGWNSGKILSLNKSGKMEIWPRRLQFKRL